MVYIFSSIKRKSQTVSVSNSFKTFGILAVGLIVIGLQCRTSVFTIDYDTMVYDKTVKYASALNFQTFDDQEKIGSLQRFMTSSEPDYAKGSLKHKCQLVSKLYISLLDDLIEHCNLSAKDTFVISTKTKDRYTSFSIGTREKNLADSLLNPLVDEINNTKSEVYARLRFARGFAEMEELNNMKNSLKENQDKVKNYYYTIFNEELK